MKSNLYMALLGLAGSCGVPQSMITDTERSGLNPIRRKNYLLYGTSDDQHTPRHQRKSHRRARNQMQKASRKRNRVRRSAKRRQAEQNAMNSLVGFLAN